MFELTGYWSLLYQVPVGLVGLSFLVFIHEAGHFLVAKRLGVKVNTFSIGFGKKLVRWRRGDTEYCISAIPFGGYVAMAGEQPDDEGYGNSDEFRVKPIPTRMAIAFAGPATNIAFSFLILFLMYLWGVQEPQFSMVVGDVEKGSAAELAGVRRGDELLAFKGRPVKDWEGFMQDVAAEAGNRDDLRVRRGNDTLDLRIRPVLNPKLGIAVSGITGESSVHVEKVIHGKPAEAAGLQPMDTILAIDGIKVSSPNTLVDLINASKGQEIALRVRRAGAEMALPVRPVLDPESQRYIVGIYPAVTIPTTMVKRGVAASLAKSWEKNWDFSTALFKTLRGIFTGHIKAKALSGPVGILQMIAASLHASVQKFIEFMALISTNLGVMNLLPLAITDGGVIFFLLLEAVRRKPLQVSTQMRINQIAISFFLVLALFVTFHDILRIPWFLN